MIRNYQNNSEFKWDLVYGAIAGAVAKTVIAPIDRTKIIFQTSPLNFSYAKFFAKFSGIVKNEGFLALWRGNSAMIYRVIPYTSIQFAVHEKLKSIYTENIHTESLKHRFALGSASGIIAMTCTYPLDISRARLAVTNSSNFRNIKDIIQNILRTKPLNLYRGYISSLLGIVMYSGTGFMIFETLKNTEKFDNAGIGLVLSGVAGGLVSQIISYPIDILRRNMQVHDLVSNTPNAKSLEIVKELLSRAFSSRKMFIKTFYKAASLNLIKGPLGQGTAFTVFWTLRTHFNDDLNKN